MDWLGIRHGAIPAISQDRQTASTTASYGLDRMSDCWRSFLSHNQKKGRRRTTASAPCETPGVYRPTFRSPTQLHVNEKSNRTVFAQKLQFVRLSAVGAVYDRAYS